MLKRLIMDNRHPFGHGYVVAAGLLDIKPPSYCRDVFDILKIRKDLSTHGFAIVKNIGRQYVKRFKREVLEYLTTLPRVPGKEINITNLDESLSKNRVKELIKVWPLHKQFGAPVELDIFHLKISWLIRQNPNLYNLYSHLLNTDDILANIDRISMKLPGSGETEFIHIDRDPNYWTPNAPFQSMMFFSESSFYCIPGSHTEDFHREVVEQYGISKKDKPRPMTMIDKTRDKDLMNLESKIQRIQVGPGDLLIWSENLWHASRPNMSDKIRLALYFGYTRRHESPNTRDERLASFLSGDHPPFYPSGGRIHLVPRNYNSFPYSKPGKPSLMQRYLDILPTEYWGEKLIKKTGKLVYWLDNEKYTSKIVKNYQPPRLSKLGEKLLGI